ncbi:MAG: hypothetical protein O3A85_11030 [Proteobacteria bacterium]|nr:hypothetical protein [Pseudomonadota bacterium]
MTDKIKNGNQPDCGGNEGDEKTVRKFFHGVFMPGGIKPDGSMA